MSGDDIKSEILAVTEMANQEPTDQPQARELVSSLECLQEDQSSKDCDDARNSISFNTLMEDSDQGKTQIIAISPLIIFCIYLASQIVIS